MIIVNFLTSKRTKYLNFHAKNLDFETKIVFLKIEKYSFLARKFKWLKKSENNGQFWHQNPY